MPSRLLFMLALVLLLLGSSFVLTRAQRTAFLAAIVSLSWAGRAHADEITILAAHDTTIYEHEPSFGNGAGRSIFSGRNSTGTARRALIAFDLGRAVPRGSRITGATLSLTVSRTHPGTTMVALHRVISLWGEGTSRASGGEGGGTMASEGDATWSHRGWPATPWQELGGDFVPEASADAAVEGLGTYTWSTSQLTQDVQAFLDQPETSFGWILIGDRDPRAVAKRFDSRDGAVEMGPRLTVSFEPPSDPTGACCFSDGTCGLQLDPGDSCNGEYLGRGSSCEAGACAHVAGACCLPDASATCMQSTREECAGPGLWQGASSSCEPNPCPVVLAPFVDPLPLPAVAQPIEGEPGAAAVYRIRMVQLEQQLHRDLPPTKVWGFADRDEGGGYPGPTIEARRDQPVTVTWANDLRDDEGRLLTSHALTIDHCLHGAHSHAARTVVHLHGGHVPAGSDGQPELTLLPGEETTYEYPNQQRAATIWYHDHAVGITRLNVYMGLAGFYLVRDPEEEALDLPKGKYEIPLAIQDRTFNADGSLRYPDAWEESVFGDQALVNGKVRPYLEVDRGLYRFRMLNGSTSRTYTLSLSNGHSFEQIGNDGGLLPEAQSVRKVTISPGERADIVIDFEYAGDELILQNSAPTPFPLGGDDAPLKDIMKFVVGRERGHTDPLPVKLTAIDPPDASEAVMTRDFVLARSAEDACGAGMWLINDLDWGSITERPHLGTSEIWRFINKSGITHPMHMHLLFFRVLDRQSFKAGVEELVLEGEPRAPSRGEQGWKDTVQVGPFEVVRVLARFEDYEGRYAYHCHLLEHEDHGMMRQFETVAVCGDGARARGHEECDDGNEENGDGCDEQCRIEGRERDAAVPEDAAAADDASVSTPVPAAGSAGCHAARPPGANTPSTWVVFCAVLLVLGRRARRPRTAPTCFLARRCSR